MARAKLLEDRHIEHVRGHIGAFLNTHRNPALGKGATFLEESFEIWLLRADELSAVRSTSPDLSTHLSNTGRWHHQVTQNGEPVGYALSGPAVDFNAQWSLHGVFASPLAKKVRRAVAKIDRERPQEDLEAFYVVIPAYRIVCFLLRGYAADEVFVVKSTSAAGGPEEGKFYTPSDFLAALSKIRQVAGILVT